MPRLEIAVCMWYAFSLSSAFCYVALSKFQWILSVGVLTRMPGLRSVLQDWHVDGVERFFARTLVLWARLACHANSHGRAS
jgi:hypothetical protein